MSTKPLVYVFVYTMGKHNINIKKNSLKYLKLNDL